MTAPSPEIRHAHVSLFHGARVAAVVRYLIAVAAGVDIFTTTETKVRVARRLRRRLRKRWLVFRRGEYVTALRRARFRSKRGTLRRFTREHRVAAWRDLWVHIRLVVDVETGVEYLIVVGHFAAGVESGSGYRVTKKAAKAVRTHRAGLDAVGEFVERQQRKHPDRRIVLAGDFNTRFDDPAWVEHTDEATGLNVVWGEFPPTRGTHAGGRPIDAIAVSDNVEVLGARVLPMDEKPDEVDHVAMVARYRAAA